MRLLSRASSGTSSITVFPQYIHPTPEPVELALECLEGEHKLGTNMGAAKGPRKAKPTESRSIQIQERALSSVG
jgi:hypothetical protein